MPTVNISSLLEKTKLSKQELAILLSVRAETLVRWGEGLEEVPPLLASYLKGIDENPLSMLQQLFKAFFDTLGSRLAHSQEPEILAHLVKGILEKIYPGNSRNVWLIRFTYEMLLYSECKKVLSKEALQGMFKGGSKIESTGTVNT